MQEVPSLSQYTFDGNQDSSSSAGCQDEGQVYSMLSTMSSTAADKRLHGDAHSASRNHPRRAEEKPISHSAAEPKLTQAPVLPTRDDGTVAPVLVLKVGTSTLMETRQRRFSLSNLGRFVDAVCDLKGKGFHVILVSSGAVGAGCIHMNIERPKDLVGKQAVSAIGQCRLMRLYEDIFAIRNQKVGQLLLTRVDLMDRSRFINFRNTLIQMLCLGVVPIINENDSLATESLKFGDNDTLAAYVAVSIGAHWLFLLTDVDCLYTANPRNHPEARPIPYVGNINAAYALLDDAAGNEGTSWGTGGMRTKIIAAKLSVATGIHTALCHGAFPERILDIIAFAEGFQDNETDDSSTLAEKSDEEHLRSVRERLSEKLRSQDKSFTEPAEGGGGTHDKPSSEPLPATGAGVESQMFPLKPIDQFGLRRLYTSSKVAAEAGPEIAVSPASLATRAGTNKESAEALPPPPPSPPARTPEKKSPEKDCASPETGIHVYKVATRKSSDLSGGQSSQVAESATQFDRVPSKEFLELEAERIKKSDSLLHRGLQRLASQTADDEVASAPSSTKAAGEADDKDESVTIVTFPSLAKMPFLGTIFAAQECSQSIREQRRWILSLPVRGKIFIDDGCARAVVEKKKSLFAAGIKECIGNFYPGEAVAIYLASALERESDEKKPESEAELARCLINYSHDELAIIKGHRTSEFSKLLGGTCIQEVAHRSNIIFVDTTPVYEMFHLKHIYVSSDEEGTEAK